jgi:Uma2 family endonuclease
MSPDILLERGQRITVDLYHRMVASGVFSEDDRLELIDGWIINKRPQTPLHASCIQLVQEALNRLMPAGYCLRIQLPVTFSDSEPEPDFAVVSGSSDDYNTRHPNAREITLIVEVAHTSLSIDQKTKQALYARESIPCYWIVDVVNRCVEVYSGPSGPIPEPHYGPKAVYNPNDKIPFEIPGQAVSSIPVISLLPKLSGVKK